MGGQSLSLALYLVFRATRDFTISMSNDNVNFDEVVEGTLTNALNKECSAIELETFDVSPPRMERFIKFTAVNYYGQGAALQYLTWF